MRNTLDSFQVGDKVVLLLYYGFHGEAPPQGAVVMTTSTRGLVKVKMDRNGRLVGFKPSDLRIISKRKQR